MKTAAMLQLLCAGPMVGPVQVACGKDPTEPPVPSAFEVVASLPEPRYDAAVAAMSDGRVIVMGGADLHGNVHSTAYVFDPASTALRRTRCDLVVARRRAVAARLADGRVILLGGDTGNLYMLMETEIYDPASDCFIAGPEFQERRSDVNGPAVLLADGRLLVILNLPETVQEKWHGGAQILDRTSAQFRSLDRDLGRLTDHVTVSPLADGRVLLTGGWEPDSATGLMVPTDRAVLFEPSTEQFRELGKLCTS
jgi:hypothetical protein